MCEDTRSSGASSFSSGRGTRDSRGPPARSGPHHRGGHSPSGTLRGPYWKQHCPKPAGPARPSSRTRGQLQAPHPRGTEHKGESSAHRSLSPTAPHTPPVLSSASCMVSLSKTVFLWFIPSFCSSAHTQLRDSVGAQVRRETGGLPIFGARNSSRTDCCSTGPALIHVHANTASFPQ